jgi:HEAT repeat protein
LALGYIGDREALAPLLAAFDDKMRPGLQRAVFVRAVGLVRYRGPDLTQAVPILVSCLQDTNQFVPLMAATTLGTLALQPELCIPALSNATRSTDFRLRLRAIQALGEFGLAAAPALDVVSKALNDPDVGVRVEAKIALEKIQPGLETNGVSGHHE